MGDECAQDERNLWRKEPDETRDTAIHLICLQNGRVDMLSQPTTTSRDLLMLLRVAKESIVGPPDLQAIILA